MKTLKTTAVESHEFLVNLIFELGKKFNTKIEIHYYYDGSMIIRGAHSDTILRTFHDLTEAEEFVKGTVIKLNDSYEAIVSEEGVKVGCQTIPFEKIKEVAEAVKKFESKKS